MLKWSDDLTLGISAIDEQHEKLLEIANRAYELLKDDLRFDKYDEIVSILTELKDYTVYHFNAEEEYMKSIGYPRLLSHKVEHNDFVDKMNDVNLDTVDSNQDKYLLELLDFIAGWVVSHINKTDRLYAQK
jgi:hemerythrin